MQKLHRHLSEGTKKQQLHLSNFSVEIVKFSFSVIGKTFLPSIRKDNFVPLIWYNEVSDFEKFENTIGHLENIINGEK